MIYLVPQRRHNECATACVQMILEHYGRDLRYDGVSFFIPKDSSLDDIKYVLCINNIRAECYKSLSKNLKNIGHFPFIIHTKTLFFYHYVIISDLKDSKALVFDPGKSRPKWRRLSYIKRKWTGYYIEVYGKETDNKRKHYLKYPFRVFIKLLILYILFILIIVL